MRKYLAGFAAFAVIVLSATVFTGCKKERSFSSGATPVVPTQPQPEVVISDAEKISASITGIVVDENNVPVAGATVAGGSSTVVTNKYGGFRFDNISLSKNNGYVKVTKSGYFTGSRSFITTAGRTHNVRIKLLTKTNTGTFTASAGATVSLSGGGKIVMPANAITDAAGGAYTGSVNMAMTWLDPTSNELPYTMPGDLRGITTAGYERGLESFGMIGVEMTGSTGQELKIVSGKTAEITFPIPAAIAGSAPATIDLWHFDEATGRWKQEGTATKTGTNYVGQVAHFSFWNVDQPYPLVTIRMTITNQANGETLNGVQVRIKRPNGSPAYARADSLGNISGRVPANEALILEILGQCNAVVGSKNIGPFTDSTSLGTIGVTIPAGNSIAITGTVKDCNNTNVANGSAIIYMAGGFSYNVPITNGAFTFTGLNCTSNTINFSVLPVDITAQQQGAAFSGNVTSGSVNVGSLLACGTSTQEHLEVMIDGSPMSFVAPADSLLYSDSTLGMSPPSVYPVIKAFGGVNPNRKEFTLSFQSNTGATGNFAILNLLVKNGTDIAQQASSANPTVTVTELGPKQTGYIAGSFSVQMNFSGTQRTVTGSFRVRRRF